MSFRRPDFHFGAPPIDAAERAELARQHRILSPSAIDEFGAQEVKSSGNPTGKRYESEEYAVHNSDEYVWWPANTTIDDPANLKGPYAHVLITTNDYDEQFLRFVPTDTTFHVIGLDGDEIKPAFVVSDRGEEESFVSTTAIKEDSWFDLLRCTGTAYTAANISLSYYQWVRYFGPYATVAHYADTYVKEQGIANVHKTVMNGAVMFDTQSWWNVWKMLIYGAMRYNDTTENKDAWLELLEMPQNTPNRYLSLFREFKRLTDSSEFKDHAPPRNKTLVPHPNDMKHKMYTEDGYDWSERTSQEPGLYMQGICNPSIHWPHQPSLHFAVAHFGLGYNDASNDYERSVLAQLRLRPMRRNWNLSVLKKWFGAMTDGGEGDMSLQAMAAAFEADERKDVPLGMNRGPAVHSFYRNDTAFDLILYSLLVEHSLPFRGKIQPTREYFLDTNGDFEGCKRNEGAFYDIFPKNIPHGTTVSTDYQVKSSNYTQALFFI
jgi:hypothetical protein